MARSQPIFLERKEKERRLAALSSKPTARQRAMALAARRMKRPATYFNHGTLRPSRATRKSLARCLNPAYVLGRISNVKNKIK
jgi:hypothetical protein